MSDNRPVIELNNVVKTYQMGKVEVNALSGVSAAVKRGEMVAIMGPSGSGKSTLMNIIGCLDRPTSGSYMLDGVTVGGLNDDELAEIRNQKLGFIFQTFNLLARTTAMGNVELPLIYRGAAQRREKALQALARVHIDHRASHKPSELSGGEQQRVAIARALVNEPPVLLADEPTGNLDSRTGHEILALFEQLHKEGITVILVTHDREIGEHAQRIISLKDGQIASEEIRGIHYHASH